MIPALAPPREFISKDTVPPDEALREQLQRPADGGYHYLPIELFRTETARYVFDARNVCFMEVEPVAFDMLAILRKKPALVDELIQLSPQYPPQDIQRFFSDLVDAQAGGLLLPYEFQRYRRCDGAEHEEVLTKRLAGFTIFVTTQCNLSCSYCIYGGQYPQHKELSDTPMSWDTLRATMDFLARHSGESRQVRLDFFGGEPLLAFPMIEKAVRYLESLVGGRSSLIITIASNGTVLTDRILEFLIERNAYFQVSIDGGRQSHDRFRRFRGTSQGTFDSILRNLQRIYDRDSSYYRRYVRAKGVLTSGTLDEDDSDFFDYPLIRILIAEGNFAFVNLEPHYDSSKDSDYFDRLHAVGRRLLSVEGAHTEEDLLAALNRKQRVLYYDTFALFFEAQAIQQVHLGSSTTVGFTRCCLLGYADGAVRSDGRIFVCHKADTGELFEIGNVLEGRWYFDRIERLKSLLECEWAGCSSCGACQRL